MKSIEKEKGVRRYFRGEFRAKNDKGEECVIGVVYPAGTQYSDKTDDEFIDELCEFAAREAVKLSPTFQALTEHYDCYISIVELSQETWEMLQQLQLATSSPGDIIATATDNKLEVIQNGQTEERNTLH